MKRLKWNWKKLFKARGVDNPYGWLRTIGFRHDIAHRLANDKCDKIALEHVNKLCHGLNCTPDDALEYEPTEAEVDKGELALLALGKSMKTPDEANLLRRLTYKELKEFAKILRKKLGGGKNGEDSDDK